MVETTGIRPASRRSRTAAGSTSTTSPTRPMSCSSPSTTTAPAAGAEQPGILAGEADRHRSVLVEQPDELASDLAGEHHPHDVHDLRGGDPQPAAELALEAEPVEHGLDLRTAAVHDDGAQPGVPEEDDVLRERGLELVVDHRVAAVLDDDERPAEPLEPGQRLDERHRLGLGDAQRGGVDRAAQGLLGGVIGRASGHVE